MFKALFNIILNLVATLVQLIMWPLNQILVNAFPNISEQVTSLSSTLVSMFDGMGWAVGIIPIPVKIALVTIIGLEISKHSAYIFSHNIVKVWNLIQKIKFW